MTTRQHQVRGNRQAKSGERTSPSSCLVHCQHNPRKPSDRLAARKPLPENVKASQWITPAPNGSRPETDSEHAPTKKIDANPSNQCLQQLRPSEDNWRHCTRLQEAERGKLWPNERRPCELVGDPQGKPPRMQLGRSKTARRFK